MFTLACIAAAVALIAVQPPVLRRWPQLDAYGLPPRPQRRRPLIPFLDDAWMARPAEVLPPPPVPQPQPREAPASTSQTAPWPLREIAVAEEYSLRERRRAALAIHLTAVYKGLPATAFAARYTADGQHLVVFGPDRAIAQQFTIKWLDNYPNPPRALDVTQASAASSDGVTWTKGA